jgi:transposase
LAQFSLLWNSVTQPAGQRRENVQARGARRQFRSAQTGRNFPIIVIHEAGLDGFWVDRVLKNEGIESHVVDPASVATSRRRRWAKNDKIDGEALVRTLLAYKRGEPRVCANGQGADSRGRGSSPSLPRAQSADHRASQARQSH